MQKLSVIIVNYNVKFFLEQCLLSVRNSSINDNIEILVVDNNSVDGSVAMIKEKFPEVILIENKENLGFSKANNMAINRANAEYILLLNPDTIVQYDSFEKCVRFMDENPQAGGLGVKMLDGKGRFLPESKRGLPTPMVALWKIVGLSSLFPKSKIFGKYHLGYLDKEKTHEVPVLSGAYMFMRKKTLEQTGLLDEAFFMYGEDIDLSYRIVQSGYKNYYFPETRIIHYKGESTKKSSINYVFVFYKAMIIFAKKHFSRSNARILELLILFAIWFRASIAVMSRLAQRAFLPLSDALIIFTGMFFIKEYWETAIKHAETGYYPEYYTFLIVPAYICIWLFCVFIWGGYDRPIQALKILKGLFAGTVFILVIYALLPEEFRFSRALLLFGALWAGFAVIGYRNILSLSGFRRFKIGNYPDRKFIIIGDHKEAARVLLLMQETKAAPGFIGFVNPDLKATSDEDFLGNISQLQEIIMIYSVNEIIFCAKNIPPENIIDFMSEFAGKQIDFKIAPQESLFIIGSNSVHTTGDLYGISLSAIMRPENRRSKRLLDLSASMFFLLFWPLICLLVKKPFGLIRNSINVLHGKKTWVGYIPVCAKKQDNTKGKAPAIKPGILNPADALSMKELSDDNKIRLNMLYARDYKTWNDIGIIMKGIKFAGRKTRANAFK